MLKKVKAARRDHALQRIALELQLETTTHDSRFSNQLLGLMQKEEIMQRDGTGPPVDLVRKTDEMLGQETRKFFAKTTGSNVRRWNALDAKLSKERDRLKSEVQSSSGSSSSFSSPSLSPSFSSQATGASNHHSGLISSSYVSGRPGREITEEDLDIEAARLEEDYNRNWLQYEGFNLREAFKSQKTRVDSEWAVHENAILDEYTIKKNELTGKSMMTPSPSHANGSNVSPDSGGRWQHPEKQKTLIHTAPVLSPSKKGGGSGSFPTTPLSSPSNKKTSAVIAVELEKLDQTYQLSKMALDRQKAGALRWMSRQQIRLLSQAEEVSAERQVIASILSREIKEFVSIEQGLQGL